MNRALAAALVAAGLATTLPAAAQKSADTLRITWRDAVVDVTPYYNQQRTGIVIGHQAWDSLVYRDPETFQLRPLLAEILTSGRTRRRSNSRCGRMSPFTTATG